MITEEQKLAIETYVLFKKPSELLGSHVGNYLISGIGINKHGSADIRLIERETRKEYMMTISSSSVIVEI
jgi:hypothetical protein